jgi:hypothetical protein
MTSFTPGPWRWEYNKQAKSVYLVGGKPLFDKTVMQFGRWGMSRAVPLFNSQITGNEYNIMERLCDVPAWVRPFPGFEHHASWRMDVTHPDAVLMSAAPELLEALKELLDSEHLTGSELGDVIDRANAAIAKATS